MTLLTVTIPGKDVPVTLLEVTKVRKEEESSGRWCLITRKGGTLAEFASEVDAESWWIAFQKHQQLHQGRDMKRSKFGCRTTSRQTIPLEQRIRAWFNPG